MNTTDPRLAAPSPSPSIRITTHATTPEQCQALLSQVADLRWNVYLLSEAINRNPVSRQHHASLIERTQWLLDTLMEPIREALFDEMQAHYQAAQAQGEGA